MKGLGRKPDRKDPRDYTVHHVFASKHALGLSEIPVPSQVDVFSGLELPVYDQGSLGSCTANAGVLYRRFLAQKFPRVSASDEDLSRLFLYYQERKLPWNNDTATDSGASIRDIFYTLANIGVCAAVLDPYVEANFADPSDNDSPNEIWDAALYKIASYARVPDVRTAKACLASGYAVALGFTVYSSFEEIGSDGVMSMPNAGEGVLGGHAVVIRGYDEFHSRFLVQNSWGPEWGINGCFWMPYQFLEDQDLSQFDMWVGHL